MNLLFEIDEVDNFMWKDGNHVNLAIFALVTQHLSSQWLPKNGKVFAENTKGAINSTIFLNLSWRNLKFYWRRM